MDLKLSRHFLHGTDRGGEDLYLKVEIEEADERQATNETLRGLALSLAFGQLWERLSRRLSPEQIEKLEEADEDVPEDDTGVLAGDDEDAELWVEGGKLRCRPTPSYEFEFSLSKEEAWEKVREIADGEWFKSLKTGVCKVSDVLYVDGNAE